MSREKDRYVLLSNLFYVFKKHFEARYGGILNINTTVMFNIIESYYLDINRLQQFHDITHKDDIKRAAFTVKWLVRLRPITFTNTNGDSPDKLLLANEMFAMFVAISLLEWPPSTLSRELWRLCYYTFHYRSFEEGMFMLFLLALRPKGPVGGQNFNTASARR